MSCALRDEVVYNHLFTHDALQTLLCAFIQYVLKELWLLETLRSEDASLP